MGAFVGRAPVRVRVDERPDEWIEIKTKLSVGDRGRLTDAIMSVTTGAGGDADVALHAGQYQLALLQGAVVDWRLLDEEGGFVPFDRERIADLDVDDALVDKTLGEIARRNPLAGKAPAGPASTKAG